MSKASVGVTIAEMVLTEPGNLYPGQTRGHLLKQGSGKKQTTAMKAFARVVRILHGHRDLMISKTDNCLNSELSGLDNVQRVSWPLGTLTLLPSGVEASKTA